MGTHKAQDKRVKERKECISCKADMQESNTHTRLFCAQQNTTSRPTLRPWRSLITNHFAPTASLIRATLVTHLSPGTVLMPALLPDAM